MSHKKKVKIPSPYPAYAGENSFTEWADRNIPCPEGMSQLAWVQKHVKQGKDESRTDWLARLSQDPIWSNMLIDVPPFMGTIYDIRSAVQGRIDSNLKEHVEFFDYFREVGRLGDAGMQHLKNMGWFGDQAEERSGRYGYGLEVKNAMHMLFCALGIRSNLAMRLDGRSFYHTNTVTPNQTGRLISRDRGDVFNPTLVGPWTLMVTNQTTPDKTAIAIKEHQLGYASTNQYMTERPKWDYKWQNYQVIVHLTISQEGLICLRAWLSPERMVANGLVRYQGTRKKKVSKPVVTEQGGKLIERFEMVTVDVKEEISEYRAKLDTETCEPLILLQRLEGFDMSRIRTTK